MSFFITSTINSIKFNITPNVAGDDTDENPNKHKIPNCQELEVVEQLNKSFKQKNLPLFAVWAQHCKSYINEDWSPKLDRKDGDIYIFINTGNNNVYGPIKYIDLKASIHGSKYSDMPSTISIESYEEFSKYPDHLYLCMNSTGSKFLLIDAARLRTLIRSGVNLDKAIGKDDSTGKKYIKGLWLNKNYELIKAL